MDPPPPARPPTHPPANLANPNCRWDPYSTDPSAPTGTNVSCNFVIGSGIITILVCVFLLAYDVSLVRVGKVPSRPRVALAELIVVSAVLGLMLGVAAYVLSSPSLIL
jgi:hypothetical protein